MLRREREWRPLCLLDKAFHARIAGEEAVLDVGLGVDLGRVSICSRTG